MDIVNFTDIASLLSTINRYNIAHVIIRSHLLCTCSILLQKHQCGLSVSLLVCHNLEPCKNAWTDHRPRYHLRCGLGRAKGTMY